MDAAALTDTMGLGANFYGNMIETKRTNQKQIIITGIEDERSQFNFFGLAGNLFKQLLHLGQYQSLIRNLVVRDLKVRYRNSVLGILWSLMNPLLMMLVFTVVFTVMAPVRSASVENFPIFLLCGLLPWNFFASSAIGSTVSIVANAPLIKKVYFPREVLPLSMILANLVNFSIALIVLFGMIFVFGIPLTIWALYLPVVILIQIIFTLGVGLFLATVNVF
ncbi:MAG: ABC transporter permease, partial [Chloroflexi bacterium]|nr:ABC transporter permease [Chloroflexota bacterium]